jgi:hypothetical protein
MAVAAIRTGKFYVMTHPEYRDAVVRRSAVLVDSFGESAEPGYREDPDLLASGLGLYEAS